MGILLLLPVLNPSTTYFNQYFTLINANVKHAAMSQRHEWSHNYICVSLMSESK